jgi:hypothetical protein
VKRPSLLRLSNAVLLREFEARLAKNHTDTAELIAYVAEIDRRKLYRPAGYSSMHRYCVGHFHLSEAASYRRIHAARLIRRFPAVYHALAEGRVHLSGLVLLVTHLRPENVDELLAAATYKSCRQIEQMVAERFPKADVPATIREVAVVPTVSAPEGHELAPEGVPEQVPGSNGNELGLETPAPTITRDPAAPALISGVQQPTASPAPADRDRIKPLSAKTYCVQFTMDEATHELLQQAQSLLGHRVAPGDLADVFSRALKAYVQLLERAKFAATDAPRTPNRAPHENSRHIPAHVKRTVWKRDGGQCTFVGEGSNRCEERSGLEFDHVREFARGGRATVDNIRLRCRAHNQLHAEKTFGAGFMQDKREHAIAARPLSHGSGSNSPRGEFFTGT